MLVKKVRLWQERPIKNLIRKIITSASQESVLIAAKEIIGEEIVHCYQKIMRTKNRMRYAVIR